MTLSLPDTPYMARACALAHAHELLSLKGKDTPGSIVLGKQVVLGSGLGHPLPNHEPLCRHLQMEIAMPTSQRPCEDRARWARCLAQGGLSKTTRFLLSSGAR